MKISLDIVKMRFELDLSLQDGGRRRKMAETRENPLGDPRLADRIGKPRINQIANASDVGADCKVLREIGRKPGSIIDQEISRLVSGSRVHGRGFARFHRSLPGQWKTSHSRGNVNSSSPRARIVLVPFVTRERRFRQRIRGGDLTASFHTRNTLKL